MLAPADAVFTYLRDFSDSLRLLDGAHSVDLAHLRAVFTHRAMFNRIYDAAYPSRVTREDAGHIATLVRQQNVARAVWLLDADRVGETMRSALEASGFAPKATWTGMWRSAEELPRVHAPPRITVTHAETGDSLRAWSRICAEVEAYSPAQEETLTDVFTVLQRHRANWTHLVAHLDGRAVATASLFLTRRIAAIDWVHTVADGRQRGIATHLVSKLLDHARGSYDTAVLTSTEAGERLYRRLGFRDCSRIAAWRYG